MEGVTISTLLTSVGDIVTQGITWVGSYASTIVSNPLLLLFAGIPVVGLGIGLLKRLISVN